MSPWPGVDPVKARAGRMGGLARAAKYMAEQRPSRPIVRGAITPARADELQAYWRGLAQVAADKTLTPEQKKATAARMHAYLFRHELGGFVP